MAEHVVEFGRDGRPVDPDGRLDAAAFHRNHGPIWTVLQKFLAGKSGDVLEVEISQIGVLRTKIVDEK